MGWNQPLQIAAVSCWVCVRYPTATHAWYDEFVTMMDTVADSNNNILLLGDYNIDLFGLGIDSLTFWPQSISHTSNANNLYLYYILSLTTSIPTEKTLSMIDIYVHSIGISDHIAVICTWSIKLPRRAPHGRTTIRYRTFKQFDKNALLFDLWLAGLKAIN